MTARTPEHMDSLLHHFQWLGDTFLRNRVAKSGDSLEMCTAWMLLLRLLLLVPEEADVNHTTLHEIFGQRAKLKALPHLSVALASIEIKETPAASEGHQGAFFQDLDDTCLETGEVAFWPTLAKSEGFDHLLAITAAEGKATDGHSTQHKPFLIFMDDKSRHPFAEPNEQSREFRQAQYVRGLMAAAKQETDVTPGSLLEALKEGRCCFIYHQVAKLKPKRKREGAPLQHEDNAHSDSVQKHIAQPQPAPPVQFKEDECAVAAEHVNQLPELDVYHLDEAASETFLGPIWPFYKAVRVAAKVQHELDELKAATQGQDGMHSRASA